MSSVIELKPLARVEGHGKITIFVAGRHVEKVELSLYESPRLFEALLLGKNYREVPEIICRICSLCSTVHRVTALLAVENALDIPVPPQAAAYRELIVNGGHIQSHALHLFCLVLPDLCGTTGFTDLARKEPELFAAGLKLKAVGNLVQETVGGRLIHPVTLIPGGMGRPTDRDGLLRMEAALEGALEDAEKIVPVFGPSASPDQFPPLAPPRFLAVRSSEASPLFGFTLSDGNGAFPAEYYKDKISEATIGSGNAKRSAVDGNPATTGAAARLNLGFPIRSRAAAALDQWRQRVIGADIRANSLSQAIELIHCIEISLELLRRIMGQAPHRAEPNLPRKQSGSGTAVMEAPRGVLIHSYAFDTAGRCNAADIITPTVINQAAMERDLLSVARSLEGADEEEMKLRLEMLARAYDPCISCAVHMVRL